RERAGADRADDQLEVPNRHVEVPQQALRQGHEGGGVLEAPVHTERRPRLTARRAQAKYLGGGVPREHADRAAAVSHAATSSTTISRPPSGARESVTLRCGPASGTRSEGSIFSPHSTST